MCACVRDKSVKERENFGLVCQREGKLSASVLEKEKNGVVCVYQEESVS